MFGQLFCPLNAALEKPESQPNKNDQYKKRIHVNVAVINPT